MRLTTKGRYAVTAVLDLAFHEHKGPVSLAAISERQCISLSYLEQLFARLRRNGVVKSTRGPGGGYTLNRAAADISVSDVILAVDESCQVTACDDADGCQGGYQCLTHDLWNELSSEIRNFLDGISLAEMMANESVQNVSIRQDDAQINAA
ncbi:MAG: Rrf2 family transcriptional regulator [Gammaproteobacteria bacterium]|nr:Rrf2 family transcriptional regulator [Gammaproteobacteria bacterium]NNJ96367.1 Rrf2 family transcriptional regulator [Gammaproteobacteria bacterium]